MSDAWRVASIQSFEQVPVAATTALLRVSAVSAFRTRSDDVRPMLVADDGRAVSRFASVPAPADEDGLLRCAYSVPIAMVTVKTVFSLEFDDGFVIALPHPTPGAARLDRRFDEPAAPADEPPAENEERRSELAPKLTELSEELASVRHEAGSLRDDAELGRIAQAQILHLHLEAIEARAELQAVRDLVTLSAISSEAPDDVAPDAATIAALEETRQALTDSELRLTEAVTRADSAEMELRAERAQHLELRERFATLESDARAAAERFVAAEHERDAALAARREAEESVEPLRAARTRAEKGLLEVRDQIHKMSLERDELKRQASAFDGVAVKARARATDAEAEQRKSRVRLAELETWTAELERRLADTTTQLAEARAAGSLAPAEPDAAPRIVSDDELAEIGRSAVAEAHQAAERDLADAGPSTSA